MKYPVLTLLFSLCAAVSAGAQTEIISATATWDYLHPTTGADPAAGDADFGATWHTFGGAYNGPAFTTNRPAPFHYGGITYFTNNALTGTPIGVGGTTTAPTSGVRYSAYFKKQFTAAASYPATIAEALVDDGAVIYLDGVEIRRYNMTGTVAGKPNGSGDAYTMLADGASNETVLTTISLGAISAGPHTIAISLHNAESTSSDLGLYFRLLSLPPQPILRTSLAGTLTNTLQTIASTGGGWNSTAAPGGFRLSAPGPGLRTIESENVNLTTVGDVHFSMQLYCYENSTTSNFEVEEEFSAKLILTDDADVVTEVNLLDGIIDANADGKLSQDEFNPDFVPVAEFAYLPYILTADIPSNIKSAKLSITGFTDSGSEVLSFGGALISDFEYDHDSDNDGVPDASELFTGTNPANPASVFLAVGGGLTVDGGGNTVLSFSMNDIPGRRYAAEDTTDLFGYFHLGTVVTAAPSGGTITIGLGLTPPPRFMFRIRPVP